MEKILLFIPMYNCEKQIVRVLKQLDDEICGLLSEVIIINNRSTDNGEKAVTAFLQAHPLHVPVRLLRNDDNYGLGGSHKVAFRYAVKKGFDYVIVLHGDDQGDIRNLVPYLKSREYVGYDCFLGARFMKGSKLKGYSKFRTIGNLVYNLLFTAGTGEKIYDLGSGLNMYRTAILKKPFYKKYKDNLMFNYCMILGLVYFRFSIRFFPIVWREDDQISNVKMAGQAVTVLRLLMCYIFHKQKFIFSDHRDKKVDAYTAEVIYISRGSTGRYPARQKLSIHEGSRGNHEAQEEI